MRSILTVIISTFLSVLIMGVMCLAISFSKNSNNLIGQAYFGSEEPLITIEYANKFNEKATRQKLFNYEYFDEYKSILKKHSDVVQYVEYQTNIYDGLRFVDPDYLNNSVIEIVEGRNISKSDDHYEVILKKSYADEWSESGNFKIGDIFEETIPYTVYKTDSFGKVIHEIAYKTIKFTIVGYFEQVKESQIVNGIKEYCSTPNIYGDIGIAIDIGSVDIYITNFKIIHEHTNKSMGPSETMAKFSSLMKELNALLPQRVVTGIVVTPMGADVTEEYFDGAASKACKTYDENEAIRYIVLGSTLLISVILLLMSVGSLANSVLISIDTSKKFIGLLKALGLHGKSLKSIVLFESFTLITLGIILGYGILFALYVPLSNLIGTIMGFTFASFLKEMVFVSSIYLPIYVFFGAIVVFLLLTFLFSISSLRKIAKTDPMAIISEVS